jgi:hypothetical protein
VLPWIATAQDQQPELQDTATVGRGKQCRLCLYHIPFPSPVRNHFVCALLIQCLPGRLLLRLSRRRYLKSRTLCPKKDTLSLWARIRLPRPQRSRSLHPFLTPPQHNSQHRLQCRSRQIRRHSQNSLHPPSLLPARKPARHDQRESGQPHEVSGEETDGAVFGSV